MRPAPLQSVEFHDDGDPAGASRAKGGPEGGGGGRRLERPGRGAPPRDLAEGGDQQQARDPDGDEPGGDRHGEVRARVDRQRSGAARQEDQRPIRRGVHDAGGVRARSASAVVIAREARSAAPGPSGWLE